MTLLTEVPHVEYKKNIVNIKVIDFRIELMPISNEKKRILANHFLNGDGIYGKLNNKNLLFTKDNIIVVKKIPSDKNKILPNNWEKYSIIMWNENQHIKEIIRDILFEIINEKIIGKVAKNIDVVISLDLTNHAGERKTRHDTEISDDDILSVAIKAVKPIAEKLMYDDIQIEDSILIADTETELNLIGIIKEKNNSLQLVIVTLMRKKDFKPKFGTHVVKV